MAFLRRVISLKIPEFPKEKLLYKFEDKEDLLKWMCTSDQYFGGYSKADFSLQQNFARFSGTLDPLPPPGVKRSGYCAIRSRAQKWKVFGSTFDLTQFDNLEFKMRSDGRTYIANIQCDSFREDDLYQAFIYTRKTDDFQIYKIPLKDFIPTYHGYVQYEGQLLNTKQIKTLGIVITEKEKNRTDFSLDLESIKATNDPGKEERLANEPLTK